MEPKVGNYEIKKRKRVEEDIQGLVVTKMVDNGLP